MTPSWSLFTLLCFFWDSFVLHSFNSTDIYGGPPSLPWFCPRLRLRTPGRSSCTSLESFGCLTPGLPSRFPLWLLCDAWASPFGKPILPSPHWLEAPFLCPLPPHYTLISIFEPFISLLFLWAPRKVGTEPYWLLYSQRLEKCRAHLIITR